MGIVISLWVLQFGALIVTAILRTDWADLRARLRAAFLQPGPIVLTTGCLAFLWATGGAIKAQDIWGTAFGFLSFLIELAMLIATIRRALGIGGFDFTFGSARFATLAHVMAHGLIGTGGLRLGYLRAPNGQIVLDPQGQRLPLHYTGERHGMTVAPTRAGKGVSMVIPNLLTHTGSAIVIDPKGENARITCKQRARIGKTFVLDPWCISGLRAARFNPLAMLAENSPTLIEDATLIAEALVLTETEGNGKHFSEQAADLIKGFILYLATSPKEIKTLGRLRQILTMTPRELAVVGSTMNKSRHEIVRAAAAQFITKSETERLGVLSTAQRNTYFLDSPALRVSLSASDFRFADLKGEQPVSVYLVLPVDRLTSHSRWLRLLIAQALTELSRVAARPNKPVLLILDEFAQLGRMPIIEDAYGLMAGMGIRMHAIVQDLSQLQRLYGTGWQTFVANSGILQFFGTRDQFTANYVSDLIGKTTRTVRSTSTNSGSSSDGKGGGGTSSGSSVSFAPTQRPLLFPDELMRMDRDAQVLFVENADPILATKIVYHAEPAYQRLATDTPTTPASGTVTIAYRAAA